MAVTEITERRLLWKLFLHSAIRTHDDNLIIGGNQDGAVIADIDSVQQYHGVFNPDGHFLHGLSVCKFYEVCLIIRIRTHRIQRSIRAVGGISQIVGVRKLLYRGSRIFLPGGSVITVGFLFSFRLLAN